MVLIGQQKHLTSIESLPYHINKFFRTNRCGRKKTKGNTEMKVYLKMDMTNDNHVHHQYNVLICCSKNTRRKLGNMMNNFIWRVKSMNQVLVWKSVILHDSIG